MTRAWIVASHVVLALGSLVAVLGLGWLYLGISATLLYHPATILPADVGLHDTYYLISSADVSVYVFLLAFILLTDVTASIALARIAGAREGWFRLAALLLCVHLGLALALGLVDTADTPLIGTISVLYPFTYLGSALGAFSATLIGLIVNGVRMLRTWGGPT